MVHHFLDKSADESQIGTLTGLLVCSHSCAALMPLLVCCCDGLYVSCSVKRHDDALDFPCLQR